MEAEINAIGLSRENVPTIVTFKMIKVNPYKPSALFVGHRQTVQNQISAASDQVLHCL